MVWLASNIGGQTIGATVAGALMIKDQITNFADCADLMQGLYIRQYFYTIVNYIIIFVQIVSLSSMSVQYLTNSKE